MIRKRSTAILVVASVVAHIVLTTLRGRELSFGETIGGALGLMLVPYLLSWIVKWVCQLFSTKLSERAFTGMFLAIWILFVVINIPLGVSEVIRADQVGLLVNESDQKMVKEEPIGGGEVIVPMGQKLVLFSMWPDTLEISASIHTMDSTMVTLRGAIEYQITRDAVVELYREYGPDWEIVFLEPESQAAIR